jgi:molecular chaperone GrpE
MSDDQQKPTDIDLTEPEAAPPTDAKPGETALEAPEPPPPPTPEERIATLEAEKADLRERMLRIAADFDNWKKRSRKELTENEARAKEGVLRDFLEIGDNLDRAIASFAGKDSDAKSIRDGVDLVLRQFRSKLESKGVKAIESLGQPFDPRFHEAISQTPSADVMPGSVLHEFQKGYLIGDKLLRPAMVVVAIAPPAPPAEPPAPAAEPAPESPATKPEGED